MSLEADPEAWGLVLLIAVIVYRVGRASLSFIWKVTKLVLTVGIMVGVLIWTYIGYL